MCAKSVVAYILLNLCKNFTRFAQGQRKSGFQERYFGLVSNKLQLGSQVKYCHCWGILNVQQGYQLPHVELLTDVARSCSPLQATTAAILPLAGIHTIFNDYLTLAMLVKSARGVPTLSGRPCVPDGKASLCLKPSLQHPEAGGAILVVLL